VVSVSDAELGSYGLSSDGKSNVDVDGGGNIDSEDVAIDGDGGGDA